MRWWTLVPLFLLLTACASTPVGVVRVDPRDVHRELTRDVLSSEEPSSATVNVLQEQNLAGLFDDEPEKALAKLHAHVAANPTRGSEIFALAELSFLHAERSKKPSYFLAAAIYAYAFIFPDEPNNPPDPLDARLRVAADLYNRGITAAFKSADGFHAELRSGTYPLPFGELSVVFDETSLHWAGRRLTEFVPVAELKVRGLKTRYRRPGIGAPLAATPVAIESDAYADDFLTSNSKVSVTAFLRLERPRQQLAQSTLQASLEAYVAQLVVGTENTIIVGDRRVPLEIEPTAALAYQLAESPEWERELSNFFTNLGVKGAQSAQLSSGTPYKSGRIPVVFVHGTASSSGRWAEMFNRLVNDPRIARQYQFWWFTYDTGSPIGLSASLLRDALRDTIKRLDPDGQDPALQRMVLIGHSQGGLLVKLNVIHSGTRLYDVSFDKPIDQLNVSEKTRGLLRRTRIVEPVPFVELVVFIATPHRGSYLTLNRLSQWIASFIKLPFTALDAMSEILTQDNDALGLTSARKVPTSLDQMNPQSAYIQALASIPIAPGVHAHSIIAVKRDGPLEEQDDGVVKYASAHIEGVDSELVVRSAHSVQGTPEAIEEVRRILLLHAEVE